MAMVPRYSGDYFMSKITKKVIMYAALMSAGAGQMFASEVDDTDHKKKRSWSLNCFRSCMRDTANVVIEVAPAIQQAGTAVISAATVISAAQGDEKAARTLGKIQIGLDGAIAVVNADDLREALKISTDTALAIDPNTAKGIDEFNTVVDALAPQAEIIGDLIKTAVDKADRKNA